MSEAAVIPRTTTNRTRHNLLRRPRTSVLPTPTEKRTLPFHSKKVDTVRLPELLSMMSDRTRRRFTQLWDMLCHPERFGAKASPDVIRSDLLHEHAEIMCEHGNIARVSPEDERQRPTKNGCFAFNVKESKDDGTVRQRTLLWPEYLNAVLDRHYAAEMNLRHVSNYIDAVRAEAAVVGDLAISFFQLQLPPHARQWFRFRDTDGNLYEYTRLPMGHKVSAELMQLTMETICGCPDAVCETRSAIGRTTNDVWIDGCRLAGSKTDCETALTRLLHNAQRVRATFKTPPTVATHYNFDGVAFDHSKHEVRVGPKTLTKIGSKAPQSALMTEYERLVARLIFASGALRIPLADYYQVIKVANRYCNALNSGADDKKIDMAKNDPSTFQLLSKWVRAAHQPKRVTNTAADDDDFDIVYIDASTKGWGCYIILATGELVIHGERWPPGVDTAAKNICALEAQAVANTFAKCGHRFLARRNLELRIDNTSVSQAMRRALAKSGDLNERLQVPLRFLAEHDVKYTCTRVSTTANLADAPSRLQPSSRAEAKTIPRSRGVAGRVAVCG